MKFVIVILVSLGIHEICDGVGFCYIAAGRAGWLKCLRASKSNQLLN
ncbi:hypothetical protein GLYMA_19G177450v4 [Glycine max]|nr:hypothetical protein GLYMA_19G177450v4 [Glycine max]KAH1078370.1 hypothetical protein GYH30_053396 [Glycine max]